MVVFYFQAGAPFSYENAKFWPALANFAYFFSNVITFWCPFYRSKTLCSGALNLINMRYGCLSIVGFTLEASPVLAADLQTKCTHVEKISLCTWMYAKYPSAMSGLLRLDIGK